MSAPPIVHVVDDDASVRSAIMRLLRAANYEARGYASAPEFLAARAGEMPGCLVLDVQMPGPSGPDLQEALAATDEPLPIIFLTGHGDIPMSVQAMKAGAVDFLTKPASRETLLPAVRAAIARDAEARASRARLRKWRARYELLTPREREVFAEVISGRLNKQIAADLGTAERTIKAHRANLMEKLGVQSVAELVRFAQEIGISREVQKVRDDPPVK